MDIKHNGVTTLTFHGYAMSSVTWPFKSTRHWSFPIGGPLISKIFGPKHHMLIDTILNRHCACAISSGVYTLC